MWTEEQLRVLEEPIRDMVVFAGPGSGKTTVLTEYMARQLITRDIEPEHIMSLTFTRKSATQLGKRLLEQHPELGTQLDKLHLGTFHSQLFHSLLRKMPDIPVLLKSSEQYQLAKQAVSEAFSENSTGPRVIQNFLAEVTRLKSTFPVAVDDSPYVRAFHRYEQLKVAEKRWDFDDIVLEFLRILESHGLPLEFQNVRLMLVDEFQDTNALQWRIFERIRSNSSARMYVVGDDDQSIYSFRGASSEWLVNFESYVPLATRHYLQSNFRSARTICEVASTLIQYNVDRAPKTMRPVRSETGVAQAIRVRDEADEIETIRFLVEYYLRGTETSIAVLARTRQQLLPILQIYLRHTSFRKAYDGRVHSLEFRTFHEAKGQEWDVVIILGAVANSPYLRDRSTESTESSEERRLFFVACTRARVCLYILVPKFYQTLCVRSLCFLSESKIEFIRKSQLSSNLRG
ncbi:MAG: UvrD-helicase domain-containing protein [Alicyclobacillaceae bacterium]|nr:UvrD-helicase domain-containing protein [Alicyclobacillaceae bacterium]